MNFLNEIIVFLQTPEAWYLISIIIGCFVGIFGLRILSKRTGIKVDDQVEFLQEVRDDAAEKIKEKLTEKHTEITTQTTISKTETVDIPLKSNIIVKPSPKEPESKPEEKTEETKKEDPDNRIIELAAGIPNQSIINEISLNEDGTAVDQNGNLIKPKRVGRPRKNENLNKPDNNNTV